MTFRLQFLAHRGLWQSPDKQNSIASFQSAFANSFGIEFDVRDHKQKLIVAHDMPTGSEIAFDDVLSLYKTMGKGLPLAINIKSDGLLIPLKESLKNSQVKNFFVFDMSMPETVRYVKENLPVYRRRSEFENYEDATLPTNGVWLDNFGSFLNFDHVLQDYLTRCFSVALVSPELHKREHLSVWKTWKKMFEHHAQYNNTVYICTDYPKEAHEFFKE